MEIKYECETCQIISQSDDKPTYFTELWLYHLSDAVQHIIANLDHHVQAIIEQDEGSGKSEKLS